jgi:hypothetical protein
VLIGKMQSRETLLEKFISADLLRTSASKKAKGEREKHAIFPK